MPPGFRRRGIGAARVRGLFGTMMNRSGEGGCLVRGPGKGLWVYIGEWWVDIDRWIRLDGWLRSIHLTKRCRLV